MGVQISGGIYTEVVAQGAIRAVEATAVRDVEHLMSDHAHRWYVGRNAERFRRVLPGLTTYPDAVRTHMYPLASRAGRYGPARYPWVNPVRRSHFISI